MGSTGDISGWITLFFGLYGLAAGIGEFRNPGFWAKMVREIRASSGLQFLTGMVTLTIGAVIYLANPFDPSDWLSILITVIGGWIVIEGLLILAFGDWFLGFASRMMSSGSPVWAILSIIIGLAAIFAGLLRLQV
ncbi:MAG: hypothetical protein ABJF89_10525 [Parasphingorhabdus sp.]|uniref:hypothetical protein n=1 Tax=Parasphingorhabdus sp. TaxID=2709688 RepID=UPI0032651F0D